MANVLWLRRAIGQLLTDITGLKTEVRLPIVADNVSSLFRMQGFNRASLDAWSHIFNSEPSPDLIFALNEGLRDSIVITIEMPPILEKGLDLAGIPWIDVGVSPLRFLPDWALHVKASAHFNLQAAQASILTQAEIDHAVSHVTDWYGTADLPANSVVFFAQTSRDRTLIRDRRFFSVDDFGIDFQEFLRSNNFYIKPHPWEPDTEIVRYLISNGAKLLDKNTYSIISCPNIRIVTISSSVGREARSFGRSPLILSPDVQNWSFSGIDVMRHSASGKFWAPLLFSGGVFVKKIQDSDWFPNQLRKSIPMQGMSYHVWE
jgi:hypothetical protein